KYICKDPKINDATQEPVNCTNYTAHVPCFPAPNITCKDFSGNETHFTGHEVGFLKPISCRNVNGYSYKVAVALSLFLGWLGADRFYLGYPALGLLKFCTVGFCGIGSLIDFILISMQHHSDAACGAEGLDSMLHNSEALAEEPQAQVGLEATELPTLTMAQSGLSQ
ncbi:TM2 domain-containing protein 1, partial [Myotis brandtii]